MDLLIHAKKTVPYYFPARKKTFDEFPVISKTEIRNNFDAFKSTEYLGKKLFKVTTSGSTGIPFSILQDKNKVKRNKADALFFLLKTGYRLGDRLYYFRLWKGEEKSRHMAFFQNIVKIDISTLPDKVLESIIQKITEDKSKKILFGLASSFESLNHYLEKRQIAQLDLNLISILSTSESMSPESKRNLESVLGVPVFARYSNEEQGIIAQQVKAKDDFYEVNWASYYVEIFEIEEDRKAPHGKLGRIVVTDLFNYSMPLIRYDTGDLGIMESVNDKLVLSRIEGRKMDAIYNTSGDHISSYSIYPIMSRYYDKIDQYQFIQRGKKEYLIKLNLINSFPQTSSLIHDFKNLLGNDAEIQVEFVKEIPVLSSGKRKKVANIYIKK
ncbi:phenylacetate--CoA ligase family protein [Muriicola jejuensis]|uniref:CoF synthetase n=1 Tax=Muriicola jejuensis TaxID=504488 RepID=A0A6P0UES2_9FLAO|nr:phenylacetate--CoA ligase family protein [Muriicola jejuensis]NER11507.1 CoF synthetase [Muriicola jejuensis]